MLWLAPVFTLLLCAFLMGGRFFQSGAYNWWYTMLLPGALTLACSLAVQKDARMKYRGILALPVDLRMIWAGKTAACAGWLLCILSVFFLGITAGGMLFGGTIPLQNSMAGSLLIFITFLWQIPLCLFLASRFGLFAAVLLNMFGNVLGVVTFDIGGLWDFMPYTLTFRLMCPVLFILPNGLPVPADSPLRDTGNILADVLVSLAWFGLLFFLTAHKFRRQEAK
ncbi:lantibiotic immunity ABC transporter MutE/EpiE family permease subunit [Paenibacillus sp. PK3_47]|uniref:lantibiotic immunity ABC transporter MutE/EpiE family permease subunit n=1 Tax=Paenibacillus sp. PK3_47 TaxID=2072642 RepID=UPI00201D88F5|nr:lantibiotic immunity ABC transporter MutE/EpiE family permease subunit [Paenibacillus sp. PK3_47]